MRSQGITSGSAIGDYEKAHSMVVSDPEIMGGTPVVRGTRIPVRLIAEMRRYGTSVDEILAGYPSLDSEMVRLAEIYAEAHPSPDCEPQIRLPRGARVVARKTCPLERAS